MQFMQSTQTNSTSFYLFITIGVVFIGVMTFAGFEIGKSRNAPNDDVIDGNDGNDKKWQAVGGAVGAAVGILTFAFVYFFWFRQKSAGLTKSASSTEPIFTSSDLDTMKTYGALPDQVTRRNQ